MTQQTQAQRLADWCEILAHTVDAYDAQAYRKAAAKLRHLHAENEMFRVMHKSHADKLKSVGAINAQLLEALRDMVNTLTDGPDESDIARVFSVARAAIAAAKGEA